MHLKASPYIANISRPTIAENSRAKISKETRTSAMGGCNRVSYVENKANIPDTHTVTAILYFVIDLFMFAVLSSNDRKCNARIIMLRNTPTFKFNRCVTFINII